MALIKEIELTNGSVGDYIRITVIHIDTVNNKADINYGLIKDKDFRDANWNEGKDKIFITQDCLTLEGQDFIDAMIAMDSGTSTLRAYSYGKLKEKKFPDAIDG